jgi:hypothetical protein
VSLFEDNNYLLTFGCNGPGQLHGLSGYAVSPAGPALEPGVRRQSRKRRGVATLLPTEFIPRSRQVLLNAAEIRRSVERVKKAFPRFVNWEHINEVDDSHMGFSIWGEFVPEPNEQMPRRFFITFDTHKATWTGHLTIGQHCFFWSSADVGDAHLLDTDPCATLEDAITALKHQIADLFDAFSG